MYFRNERNKVERKDNSQNIQTSVLKFQSTQNNVSEIHKQESRDKHSTNNKLQFDIPKVNVSLVKTEIFSSNSKNILNKNRDGKEVKEKIKGNRGNNLFPSFCKNMTNSTVIIDQNVKKKDNSNKIKNNNIKLLNNDDSNTVNNLNGDDKDDIRERNVEKKLRNLRNNSNKIFHSTKNLKGNKSKTNRISMDNVRINRFNNNSKYYLRLFCDHCQEIITQLSFFSGNQQLCFKCADVHFNYATQARLCNKRISYKEYKIIGGDTVYSK